MQQRQCFTQGENVELLAQYGLFLAKIATVVVAIAVIAAIIVNLAQRKKQRGELRVTNLSEHYKEMKESLAVALLDGPQQKQWHKAQKKKQKQEAKAAKARAKLGNAEPEGKPRAWVLDFKGSMDAHEVNSLREEITAVLAAAKARDQVVIRLESPGGVVHGYGLAASQLQRLRDKQIPLTVAVDKVAASGGYMMACVANKIVSAPFAILGSIGVVAQIPNLHRFLKNKDIDIELHTAGSTNERSPCWAKIPRKGGASSARISMRHIICSRISSTGCVRDLILSRWPPANTGTGCRRWKKVWWMRLKPAMSCCWG